LRSLAVGAAVVAAAERDFAAAERIGRANLARSAAMVGDGPSRRRVDAWAAALDEGPQAVRVILLDRTDHGHDLRQMSPLAGLITDEERLAALAAVDAIVERGARR
jgi:hypothetical protein